MKPKTLAEWVRSVMRQRKMTARAVAFYAGLSPQTILNILSERGWVTVEVLEKLARVFEEDIDYLRRISLLKEEWDGLPPGIQIVGRTPYLTERERETIVREVWRKYREFQEERGTNGL